MDGRRTGLWRRERNSYGLRETRPILGFFAYDSGANLEKALKYLMLANGKAIRTNALEEVKAYFHKAMKVLARPADSAQYRVQKIAVPVSQIKVFFRLLRPAGYRELFERFNPVAAKIEESGLRGAFYARLGF